MEMKSALTAIVPLLSLVYFVPKVQAQTEDDVVINEFVVNPASGKEYVELLVVANSVDMQGWTISDVGTRAGSTSTTEGDITLPSSATFLASIPQGTYVVFELSTPNGGTSTLTEDLSLGDATPKTLVIKISTSGVTTAGTLDWSTNENIQLYAGSRATGVLVDQVLGGNNSSYITGATWGDNDGSTNTDNINGGSSVNGSSAIRFVPAVQSSPAGFRDNDLGSVFVVDPSSYGTPGTVNTGVNDAPLPITLAGFEGSIIAAGSAHLSWSTINEVDNYGFEVERAARNSGPFQKISTLIPGHGTTNVTQHYSYADNSPLNGTGFYRLKQIDLDQSVHYSEAIAVQMERAPTENVPRRFVLHQNYPNPFNPDTEIRFSVESTGNATLRIYNAIGQQVTTLFEGVAEAGKNYAVKIDGSSLASGIYFSRLESTGRWDTKKLVLLR